jgi:hypothetical protein
MTKIFVCKWENEGKQIIQFYFHIDKTLYKKLKYRK